MIGTLAKAVQQLFGDTGISIIGTRHGVFGYEEQGDKNTRRMQNEIVGG